MRRVGMDVDAATYWSDRSTHYADGIAGSYHRHRLEVVRRLIGEGDLRGRVCLDVGCGEGVFIEPLLAAGAQVIAFDPDPELVRLARERAGGARIMAGGLELLEGIAAGSIDLLLALNVLAYFTDDEQETFYRAARRIVKPGGTMVVTHSNELFDLYTLNAFTVDFFARHFCGGAARDAIAGLLARPDVPKRITFNVRENPLSYGHKLRRWGFEEVRQEFANLHELPPLLMDPEGFRDIDRRQYATTLDWSDDERWKLLFTCSMFGSRSVRASDAAAAP